MKNFTILICLAVLMLPLGLQAENDSNDVLLQTLKGEKIQATNIYSYTADKRNRGKQFKAIWKGSTVNLHFKDFLSVTFFKPYHADIRFKDGRNERFKLIYPRSGYQWYIRGDSIYGDFKLPVEDIARIDF